ncbi:Pyruvate/Phosphoenolpyruvate kinase [Penicillium cf. griseofulvum]|nr:Pyruvate/Phosphoenolpyruvate kinase [Penicillium cf. griseofulvum]
MAAPGYTLRRTALASSSLLRTRVIPATRTQDIHILRTGRCPALSSHVPTPYSFSQTRHSSYSGPASKHAQKGEPITMLTAYDFPSAHVADASGMDMVLVGDSLGMVALGLENTTEVVMEEMILHCRSVARATKAAFIVGDLPMGSYEVCAEQAIESSLRLVKEGRVHGVKLEGSEELAPTIKRITQAGVPVVGHVGLTPQRQNALGGFRVQGKTAVSAIKLLRDALALQEAGAFMLVLEAMPSEVASIITQKLRIPTIGIGAGNGCSGQVLVQVDMTGNFQPGRFVPKFVKQYADVWDEAARGISLYRDEVKSRAFPSKEYTYPIAKDELDGFQKKVDEVFRES